MAEYVGGSWDSPESDLEASDFCKVCLVDTNPSGEEKIKAKCKLPIRRTPGGPISKAALRNAASRIFQVSGVPAADKRKAARSLVRHMRAAGIEVTSSALLRLAGMRER